MKIFSFFFFFMCVILNINAQNCTTMWPYLYENFMPATVSFSDGKKLEQKVNIHVLKNTLHFLNKEIIMEALSKDVLLVEIGNDIYYSKNGQMMKVVKNGEIGFVALVQEGDFEALQSDGAAAYGASSNSSAIRKLSSLEIGGISNTNHMEIKSNKDIGKELTLINKYYIVTNRDVYPASKKGIEGKLSAEKKIEFKTFLKKNKINWKDPDKLVLLIDFIN